MISISVCDNTLYNQPKLVMSVIHEMLTFGTATITTAEAPSFNSNGLYILLDEICDRFNFKHANITIITANPYEISDRYCIKYRNSVWITPTIEQYFLQGFSQKHFDNKKNLTQNLFGCFNNRPTWYRLCLVKHLIKNSISSIISCNTSWDENSPNCIPFDELATQVPTNEYFEVIELIKQCPIELPGGPINENQKHYQEFEKTLSSLMPLYNDFFIDLIGVTFTVGDTFYLDEKETRPILCFTPFIIYGTNGHLESMNGYGFETFGKWWDESYDQYSGFLRIQKIYQVIDYLSAKSQKELRQMYQDMLPTLRHNYNHLITNYAK